MTLRNRFLLVAFGMVIFILTTPVIVLYALGYKFDLPTRQIVKTGSLIVKSEPKKGNIYIDDILQPRKTDATVRFLLPGDYNVKVSRDGYQDWTKRLNIRSSLVTWANHEREFVALFLQNPEEKESRKVSQSAISVMERQAAVAEGTQVSWYNPDKATFEKISTQVPAFTPPATIPDPTQLYYLMRYPSVRMFSSEQISNAKQLEANENYAAILVGTNLFQVKGSQISLLSGSVSGFHLEDEHLWYVEGNTLRHTNLNLGVIENVKTLNSTPLHSAVIRGSSYLFLVLDGTLYAFNDELEEVQRGVTYAYWDNASARLVYANNNEVLVLDPVSFKRDLIIRSSTTVQQPIINRETGYLFFINESKVKAIELDGRDHRNVYTILSQPAESFLLSEDGKILTIFTDTEMKAYRIR
jgi:hypothetical protein